ncbi:AAA family ATPase, partial [Staphylococcus aureus]|nr:AAA family ATPase [Staphylococcus aureus]
PLLLVGPAGSGKNVVLEQVAKDLGKDFYFTNAVTEEYKLTGFIDASGTYQETQFYQAFTKGGIFFLDEMDASVPEALVILNAAIANRYFNFPNGKAQAHPDFTVVAAAYTTG